MYAKAYMYQRLTRIWLLHFASLAHTGEGKTSFILSLTLALGSLATAEICLAACGRYALSLAQGERKEATTLTRHRLREKIYINKKSSTIRILLARAAFLCRGRVFVPWRCVTYPARRTRHSGGKSAFALHKLLGAPEALIQAIAAIHIDTGRDGP